MSYIYCGGGTTQKVWQLDPSNMSKIAESAGYGGTIYALTADPDGLIYCGGFTRTVWQLDPSDMSKIAESASYGGSIYALTADPDGLIYCGGYITQKVYQLDPSNMSKIAESASYGRTIYALTADPDGLIYCGGDTTLKVWQLDPSNMSKIAESASYGGTIYAVVAGPVEPAVEASARGGFEVGGRASGEVVKIVKGASRGGFEVGGYAAGEVLPYVTGRVRGGFEVGGRAKGWARRNAAARGGAVAGGMARGTAETSKAAKGGASTGGRAWGLRFRGGKGRGGCVSGGRAQGIVVIKSSPVTPYIILDRLTETPLAWLDAALVSPIEIDDLTTGEMSLDLQYPVSGLSAGKITKGHKIATTDIDGAWQVYEITNTSTVVNSQGLYIKASCEHEFYELQTEKYISLNFSENTAIYALEQILFGTRWQAGTVEPAGTRTVQMPDHNPLQALSRVASVWDGELRFRVEVEANTIAGRYVDLLTRRGSITGQRFEFGHNITSAQVDIDTTSLVTAMHGRGQGEDIAEGADEPERLTFEGYEWKVAEGDPADKPLGQDWIGDEVARALYGKPDGVGGRKHIFALYESQAQTPETLIWETWHQIQKRNRPRVTADFAIADLEQIKVVDIATGQLAALDHEKARLGDTCYMIVRRADLRIELEARIIRIERHRKDPAQTRIIMGDPAPVGTDLYQELRQKARLQEAKQAVHDRAALFQPSSGDYDYELDIGEKRIRIVGQTYFYWDGAGFYAIKPTDLNKYWRYDQNGLRYTETGGVTWKHRLGIDELVIGAGARFSGDIEVGSSESGNIAGISGDGSAAGSVRFWAGHADKTQAPYRVTQDGSLYASKATLSGRFTSYYENVRIADLYKNTKGGTLYLYDNAGFLTVRLGARIDDDFPDSTYGILALGTPKGSGTITTAQMSTSPTSGNGYITLSNSDGKTLSYMNGVDSGGYVVVRSTGGGANTAVLSASAGYGVVNLRNLYGDAVVGLEAHAAADECGALYMRDSYGATVIGIIASKQTHSYMHRLALNTGGGMFSSVDLQVGGDARIGETWIGTLDGRGAVRSVGHGYLKFLGQSSGGFQSRNSSDTAYAPIHGSVVRGTEYVESNNEVYGTSFVQTSSREAKQNIEKMAGSALEKVVAAPVYEYEYKPVVEPDDDPRGRAEGPKDRHVGPMAEDLPDLITRDGGRRVSLSAMVGLLWAAVQELDAQVKELRGGL